MEQNENKILTSKKKHNIYKAGSMLTSHDGQLKFGIPLN